MTLSPSVCRTILAVEILIAIGCIIGLFGCIFMLVRNHWVYRNRMTVLFTDNSNYDRLPSYDEMMHRWWIWDVNKFLRPKKARK